ncbi:MAG: hypothetical protein ACI4EI_02210 [Muricoprocola sp.]
MAGKEYIAKDKAFSKMSTVIWVTSMEATDYLQMNLITESAWKIKSPPKRSHEKTKVIR